MLRRLIGLFVCTVLTVLLCPAVEAVEWSFVSPNQKVFPDTQPGDRHEATLYAAEGEYVAVQTALRSDRDVTLPVSISPPGEIFECIYLSTPGVAAWGFPDEEEYAELRREVYPDPLVPVEEIRLSADETKALWIRVRAEASETINVRVGEIAAEVRIELWPFAIPERPSLQTAIGLGGRGFAEHYETELWSDRYWDIYEEYYEALLAYRLSAYRPPRDALDEGARRYLTDPRVTTFILPYAGNAARMRAIWQELTDLGVAEKGWFYNIDEPSTPEEYETISGQVEYLREVAPGARYGLPFYTGLPDRSTPFDHLSGYVNLWIIQTDYYQHGHQLGDRIQRQAAERFEAGDEVWLYTALAPRAPFCNILLNNTALQHRLLFWQVYAEEIASGYIYWQSTYWDQTDDPWQDVATVKTVDPHVWGDGLLFYPGPDGPVGSIRLEAIRAGLQDIELLHLAEERWGRERAEALAREMVPSLVEYVTDPEQFEAFRLALGQMLAEEMERAAQE
ncbi:MAG: DUF4091 domain-containing protein [Armatimonadota bacterium]